MDLTKELMRRIMFNTYGYSQTDTSKHGLLGSPAYTRRRGGHGLSSEAPKANNFKRTGEAKAMYSTLHETVLNPTIIDGAYIFESLRFSMHLQHLKFGGTQILVTTYLKMKRPKETARKSAIFVNSHCCWWANRNSDLAAPKIISLSVCLFDC